MNYADGTILANGSEYADGGGSAPTGKYVMVKK